MANVNEQESDGVELLTFRLGLQDYSVEIESVNEIRGWTPATPVPFSPQYLCGVINLRGNVMPVLDLSARLDMDPICPDETAVIVIVSSRGTSVGLLVDAVQDIISVPPGSLRPPTDVGRRNGKFFLKSLALIDDNILRVLDLDALVPETLEFS